MTPEQKMDARDDAREARCVAEDPARKAAGWAPECPLKGFRFYPVRMKGRIIFFPKDMACTTNRSQKEPPCPTT